MSAAISKTRVQECVRAALADEVVALGGIAVASQECGISEDTIRRRLAGTHAWSDSEISAMVAAAWARLGRSLVQQRLSFLFLNIPAVAGDGRRARDDIGAALPALLAEAQLMASAMADGRISRDEARTLLAALPDVSKQLEQLQTDLAALLRSGVDE